jgi:hypothetical protein
LSFRYKRFQPLRNAIASPSAQVIAAISNFNWTSRPSRLNLETGDSNLTFQRASLTLSFLSEEKLSKYAIRGGKMLTHSVPKANFILHELEESLAAQLCQAASEPGHAFHSARSTAESLLLAERFHADAIFCNSEPRQYQALLNEVKLRGLRLPVVVVSRLPEVSQWLDALDAGAADYCAAPFEHQHMSWLIESALLASQHAASFA